MAGISSKAAGSMTNKHKYNGIELNEDFDVNIYDAFYRNLDVQTGRWWQIDPMLEDQEDMSPYNAMANDPVLKSDPLGDVATDGDGDPAKGAAAGALVLEAGGAEALGAIGVGAIGAGALVASAVAPVALVIFHPEAVLTSATAAQMDWRVEKQIRENANAPEPATAISPMRGAATAAGNALLTEGKQAATSKTFGGKHDTNSSTSRQAYRKAKEENGIPRSQQPDKQYKTIDKNTGKPLKTSEYTNNKGEKIIIRKDNPVKYKDGGGQGKHYNAGNPKDNNGKLKQHHNY